MLTIFFDIVNLPQPSPGKLDVAHSYVVSLELDIILFDRHHRDVVRLITVR